MKKILSILLGLFIGAHAFAQHDTIKNPTIPREVLGSFNKTHPNAKLVNWSRANGEYLATYKEKNSTLWTTYNSKGSLIENKWKVSAAELPKTLLDSIPESDSLQNKEIYKRTNANGFISYEINSPDKKIIYNANGKHVSTTEMIKRK
jgi:hypothetical protein